MNSSAVKAKRHRGAAVQSQAESPDKKNRKTKYHDQKILPTPRQAWQILNVRNHMKTKDEVDFSAQSSMSSIGDHVLNVLFVLVRRF